MDIPPVAFARTGAGDTAGMERLKGATFLMGTNDPVGFPADGEGPVRKVTVRPFWMDAATVTNTQFAVFVDATGYATDAEFEYAARTSNTPDSSTGNTGFRCVRDV